MYKYKTAMKFFVISFSFMWPSPGTATVLPETVSFTFDNETTSQSTRGKNYSSEPLSIFEETDKKLKRSQE